MIEPLTLSLPLVPVTELLLVKLPDKVEVMVVRANIPVEAPTVIFPVIIPVLPAL